MRTWGGMVGHDHAGGRRGTAQFDRDGFFVFRNVLDAALLDRLREASDASWPNRTSSTLPRR